MISPRSIATLGIGFGHQSIAKIGLTTVAIDRPFEYRNINGEINTLVPTSCTLIVPKLGIELFLTEITIPSIISNHTPVNFPQLDVPITGTKLEYSDLLVKFISDENLETIQKLQYWMYQVNQDIEEFDTNFLNWYKKQNHYLQDISISILTNNNNENIHITLADCFVNDIGPIDFETTPDTIRYGDYFANFKVSMLKIS